MIVIHITIASAIFSVMFAYRNFWQIQETWHKAYPATQYLNDKLLNARQKWHNWQFALQIYIGGVIAFASFMNNYSLLNSLGHCLLFGSVFWLIFDTLLGYKLTKNVLHVDSNGIGTIYKKASFFILDYKWQIKKLLKQLEEKERCVPFPETKKANKLAEYLLLISKVLFVTLSIIISLL